MGVYCVLIRLFLVSGPCGRSGLKGEAWREEEAERDSVVRPFPIRAQCGEDTLLMGVPAGGGRLSKRWLFLPFFEKLCNVVQRHSMNIGKASKTKT